MVDATVFVCLLHMITLVSFKNKAENECVLAEGND